MSLKMPKFKHIVIDDEPAGWENDVTLIADVDGDGQNDIIVASKYAPGEGRPAGTENVVWYQAPNWKRHTIGCGEMEAGGVVMDITGNGKLDLVIGNQYTGKELYWWENPADPTARWQRRLITDRFHKYHDQAVGDIDGDGRDELVVLSQIAKVLVYYKIPEDPTVEPWPDSCCHVIAEDIELEGLRIVDIDGDGVNEIVAGANYFKHDGDPTKPWRRVTLIEPFEFARAAVGDLNGNGHLDIVLSEGESNPGRLLWLAGPDFKTVNMLNDQLCHPHSLELADFTGSGSLDIFTGEMHLNKHDDPKIFIYVNDGAGNFTEQVIECPQGIHEGKVAVMPGSPLPSIVGKPYMPFNQVDMWLNVTDS